MNNTPEPLMLTVPVEQYIKQGELQTRLISENFQLRDALNQLSAKVRELELQLEDEAPPQAQEDA